VFTVGLAFGVVLAALAVGVGVGAGASPGPGPGPGPDAEVGTVDAVDPSDADEIRPATSPSTERPGAAAIGQPSGPVTTSAVTPVDACGTLSTPDTVYVLNGSIRSGADADCIEIAADNVTFDGNGYAIESTYAGEFGLQVGIRVPGRSTHRNVTVKNVTVSNWSGAINAGDTVGLAIRNVTAAGDGSGGVTVSGADGGVIDGLTVRNALDGLTLSDGTTDLTVRDVSSRGNDRFGVALVDGVPGTDYRNVTAVGNGEIGVLVLGGATGTTFDGLNASNNGIDGVAVQSSDVVVRNATAASNAADGIAVEGGSNVTVASATVRNNTWGYATAGGHATEVRALTVQGANRSGDGSGEANATLSATSRDVRLRATASPPAPPSVGAVDVLDEYVTVNGTAAGASANLTLSYDDAALSLSESTVSLYVADGGTWTELDSTVDATADTVTATVTPGARTRTVGAFAVDPGAVFDCRVIDRPGAYDLRGNLTPRSGSSACLSVTADNVTVDGNGYRIDGGAGPGVAVGTDAAVANVTVRNVTVVGDDDGVVLDGSDVALRSATVNDVGGRGVRIEGAGTTATVATATVAGSDAAGIQVSPSVAGARVESSLLEDGRSTGLDAAGRVTAVDTVVADNRGGVYLGADDATLANVTVRSNTDDGIVAEGQGTVIRNATVRRNDGSGLYVPAGGSFAPAGDVSVRDTTFGRNGNSGVYLRGASGTFANSTATSNGDRGFALVEGTTATFDGAVAANNSGPAFLVDGSATATDAAVGPVSVPSFDADEVTIDRAESPPTIPNATASLGASLTVEAVAQGTSASLSATLAHDDPPAGTVDVSPWSNVRGRGESNWTRLNGSGNGSTTTTTTTVSVDLPTVGSRETIAPLALTGPYFEPTVIPSGGTVEAGTTAGVPVSITNVGTNGTDRVSLAIDGSVVDSQSASLDAGETGTVGLAWDTTGVATGEYDATGRTAFESDTATVAVSTGTIGTCGEVAAADTYRLTADLESTSADDCLDVTAPNVTIDGMGRTIDAGPGGSGVHLPPDGVNVTVRNLTVTNGDQGVHVDEGARNVTIEELTVHDAGSRAVVLGASDATVAGTRLLDPGTRGVSITEDGTGTTIRDTVVRNAGTKALRIQGDTELSNVTAVNATEDAINVELGATVTVSNSTVRTPGDRGIWAEPGAVTVRDTTVVGTGGVGLEAEAGATLTLQDTTIADAGGAGIAAADGAALTVRNATVLDAGSVGVRTRDGAGDVTVVDSRIVDGGARLSGDSVTVANTTVVGGTSGLEVGADGATVRNNTVRGALYGGIRTFGSDVRLVDNRVADTRAGVQVLGPGTSLTGTVVRNVSSVGLLLEADDASVAGATLVTAGDGVVVEEDVSGEAVGVSIVATTVRTGSGWTVAALDGSTATLSNISVGTATDAATLGGTVADARLRGVPGGGLPAGPPDLQPLGIAAETEPLASNGSVDLTVRYDPTARFAEASLGLYRYDGGWTDAGATLDRDRDTLTITLRSNATVAAFGRPAPAPPGDVTDDGAPAGDLDGDGRYEDVDGDGTAGYDDVVALFETFGDPVVRTDAFDFNRNGRIDFDDLVHLLRAI
jgi:hypothetical protein